MNNKDLSIFGESQVLRGYLPGATTGPNLSVGEARLLTTQGGIPSPQEDLVVPHLV